MPENEGLKREIGTWGLAANAINIVIGAGIFILPVTVAESLGRGSLTAYIFCGLLMILIMLCFAEVGSRITVSGGAYSYIEQAFGGFAGFLTANIFIFGASFTANAAVANGLADTLSYFIPQFEIKWVRVVFFAVMFGFLAYYNVRGIRNAIFIIKFNTVAKLIPLLLIVSLGWFFMSSPEIELTGGNSLNKFGETTLILLFAFVGAETALNVSGEIINPRRTIPRGIMISMIFVVILYALIQVVVQSILGADISDFRNAPLAETAKIMMGPAGAAIIIVGTTFSMFGNISGMVLNMPRILFAAARDGVIPSARLAEIHPLFRTPHIAIILNAVLAFLFSAAGEFRLLAILSSASYMLIYLGVVLSVIRFKIISGNRSGNILRSYIVPLVSAAFILWVLSNLPANELKAMIIFIALLSSIYFVMRLAKRK